MGLSVIRDSAELTEDDQRDTITMNDVRKASKMFSNYQKKILVNMLNEKEKMLYDLIKQNTEIDSAKLFLEFQNRSEIKISDRTYRNYMKCLCELGLIDEKGVKRWKKFRQV